MESKKKMNEMSSSDEEQENQTKDNTETNYELSTFSELLKSHQKNNSSRFSCKETFAKMISFSVLSSNFESMSVNLHYGNLCFLCHILFVKLPQNFFEFLQKLGKGSYGSVYKVKIDENDYAIKVAEKKGPKTREIPKQTYKEYFLACLADQLGAGPKMTPIFGYDFLVTKNEVIFSMEQCSTWKILKDENISSELSESLSVMHSVGFVHSDIKPENIAFSEKRQKHVFLDFGLSSLRPERRGEKSLVGFIGTLSYCSEQMKKCYILRTKMFVDLYQNDRFMLEKTLLEPQLKHFCFLGHFPSHGLKIFYQNEKLINKFCTILNLKYEIFKVNFSNVMKLLQKCADIPKSFCEVFKNKNVNKEILLNLRIIHSLKVAKKNIPIRYENSNEIDLRIYECINEEIISSILQQSFPIKAIIKMEKQKFIEILDASYWLMKIFVFLDPFEAEKVKQTGREKWIDRKSLVEKIFYTFASKEQLELSDKFPGFMSLKTEFTLHFFYKRMKSMNNLKVLHSLRLLFIATMSKLDQKLIQEIEQQILSLTEDQDELILRIISFYLFWRQHNCGFDFEYKELHEWFEKVKSFPSSQQSNFSKKIRYLLFLIETCDEVNNFPKEMMALINQIWDNNQNQQLRDIILNIYLVLEFCILRNSYQQGLENFIYRKINFFIFKPAFTLCEFFHEFLKIFKRFPNELFKQNLLILQRYTVAQQ